MKGITFKLMLIIKRIPLEAYAYEELHFESIEEYEREYPKYMEAFMRIRKQINKTKEIKSNQPF